MQAFHTSSKKRGDVYIAIFQSVASKIHAFEASWKALSDGCSAATPYQVVAEIWMRAVPVLREIHCSLSCCSERACEPIPAQPLTKEAALVSHAVTRPFRVSLSDRTAGLGRWIRERPTGNSGAPKVSGSLSSLRWSRCWLVKPEGKPKTRRCSRTQTMSPS